MILAHQFGSDRRDWQTLVPVLRRAGFATLTYDIRGMGESVELADGGAFEPGEDATYLDSLPLDVAAAAEFLGERREVDPRRIAVVGASVGANIAYVASGSDLGLRGAVALSPSVTGGPLEGRVVPRFRPLGVLFAADEAEIGAARELASRTAQPKRVLLAEVQGHGVGLLADPGIRRAILSWLRDRLG